MNLFEFLIVVLAANAVVDCWFNASLFERWRTAIQGQIANLTEEGPAVRDFLLTLLDCPHCFSFHATWILVAATLLAPLTEPWVVTAVWVINYSLAGWRVNYVLYRLIQRLLYEPPLQNG